MDVLVTGGTGVLGSAVVAELVSRVHAVRVLTRHPELAQDTVRIIAGSLASAGAVAEALDGVEAVVHCATDPRKHRQVDRDGTEALLETALRSGNPHIVYPGIVGSDVIPLGYYKSKIAAEQRIEASACPHTFLRATQFHTLIWSALDGMSRFPLMVLPRDTRFQPVDQEVMARLLAPRWRFGRAGYGSSPGPGEGRSVAAFAMCSYSSSIAGVAPARVSSISGSVCTP